MNRIREAQALKNAANPIHAKIMAAQREKNAAAAAAAAEQASHDPAFINAQRAYNAQLLKNAARPSILDKIAEVRSRKMATGMEGTNGGRHSTRRRSNRKRSTRRRY